MAIGTEISRGLRLAATGSLLAAALGWFLVPHLMGSVRVGLVGLTALAAAGLARRSVLAQTLGRGAAWFVFVLGLIATIDAHGSMVAAITVAAGAALLLSVSLLYTESARAEFAPARFRKTFLAGSSSAVACATLTGGGATLFLASGHVPAGLGWLAVTAGLLGAAVGVVRMRAWGVLLGVLTTTGVLAAAAVMPAWRELLLLLAAPGALLALPVALARLGLFREDRAVAAAQSIGASTPPALRIAGDAAPVEESDLEGTEAEAGIARRLGC